MPLTVKYALENPDVADRLAGLTGLTPGTVGRKLRSASPRQLIRTVFADRWPTEADAVGDVPASTALRLDLSGEIASLLDVPPAEVAQILGSVHGNTRVRTAFADRWLNGDDENEADEEPDASQSRLAALLIDAFSRPLLRQIAVERLGSEDVRPRATSEELALEITRYNDASLRSELTLDEIRELLSRAGIEASGGKVQMFRRLMTWTQSDQTSPEAPPPSAQAPAPAVLVPQEHRVRALLIGNQGYAGSDRLRNPHNDVRALSSLLTKLGHGVESHYDLDLKAMLAAIRGFKRTLTPGEGAVFYFSGHGFEHDGDNWLVPIGFGDHLEPEEVDQESVGVSRVLTLFGGARFCVCILDACRAWSYRARMRGGGGDGLRVVQAPQVGTEGSMICFATSPGSVAYDGRPGENGEYTSALLQALATPGRRIEDVMKDVRRRVLDATAGKQKPWDNSCLIGDWYPAGPS